MTDQNNNLKSIEMRLAEIEDKLSKLHITEEEMKAYQKVSGLLGAQGAALPDAASAAVTNVANPYPYPCVIYQCILPRSITPITPRIVRQFCYECNCGPCNPGGGTFGSGGFGGFGGM